MMQNAFEKNLRTCQVCDALSHTFVNVHCPANCCARDFCNDQCGKVSSQVTTTTAAPLTTPTTNGSLYLICLFKDSSAKAYLSVITTSNRSINTFTVTDCMCESH